MGEEMSLEWSPVEAPPYFTPQRGHYKFGRLEMNVRGAEVTRDGCLLPLSPKQFRLLQYFMEHAGETLSREELLRNVWGYGCLPLSRTVDVHVVWLRQKIENDPSNPRLLVTVNGFGYKFIG